MNTRAKARPREHTRAIADLDALPNANFSRLLQLWLDEKRDLVLPPPSAISPFKIPKDLLPHVTIVSLEDGPKRFLIRLVGTAIINAVGVNLTSKYGEEADDGETVARHYEECLAELKPIYAEGPVVGSPHDYKTYRCLILPYGSAQGEARRFLSYMEFD